MKCKEACVLYCFQETLKRLSYTCSPLCHSSMSSQIHFFKLQAYNLRQSTGHLLLCFFIYLFLKDTPHLTLSATCVKLKQMILEGLASFCLWVLWHSNAGMFVVLSLTVLYWSMVIIDYTPCCERVRRKRSMHQRDIKIQNTGFLCK